MLPGAEGPERLCGVTERCAGCSALLRRERELREFTITGALLRKGGVYLHLEVLGLAEGRPNINIGDVTSGVFQHYR
ncbi:hypothetical protein XENOCAPTIV_019133 [Xenoophorus captivus]|uniref:Uncharacterized protein n=1 Tax=Xenoophorus captivus TaxID=1517983 RepID=A0ABV0SIY9_9TELE